MLSAIFSIIFIIWNLIISYNKMPSLNDNASIRINADFQIPEQISSLKRAIIITSLLLPHFFYLFQSFYRPESFFLWL